MHFHYNIPIYILLELPFTYIYTYRFAPERERVYRNVSRRSFPLLVVSILFVFFFCSAGTAVHILFCGFFLHRATCISASMHTVQSLMRALGRFFVLSILFFPLSLACSHFFFIFFFGFVMYYPRGRGRREPGSASLDFSRRKSVESSFSSCVYNACFDIVCVVGTTPL